jgi:hypothetical protein
MFKKLMITTAAAALLTGSAFAQSPTQPSQSPPVTSPAPTARMDSSAKFITEQTADQFLATKFKGTDVIGANNEKIGDVSDLLLDKDNKILAYVIGVGGFLGIGSKDVALTPASFKLLPPTDRENMKLQLSMTKDELKAAPDFKPYNPPRTAAGGSGSAPTTGQAPRDRAPANPPAANPPAERMAPPPASR